MISPAPTARILITIFAVVAVAGCGRHQPRYRVTGNVTCGGSPVPYGEVLFTPDGSLGNSGPQGIAEIRDGRFDTKGTRAPGTGGGPFVVMVTALKSPGGPLITEYELAIELPAEDCERDLEIPGPSATGSPLDPDF